MFRKLIKNKKAQNTAEYAILISLVVAGIIAMQTYAQRALQARVRDAAQFMVKQVNKHGMGNTVHYEPYYLDTDYNVIRDDIKIRELTNEVDRTIMATQRTRTEGGRQISTYNFTGAEKGL